MTMARQLRILRAKPWKFVDLKGVSKMKKWECTACGYIYDPEKGHEASDVAPNTAFEDIPED